MEKQTNLDAGLELLSDNVIEDTVFDEFGHQIYVDLLADVFSSNAGMSPISVGLFGKWGQGKSSIVNLLKNLIAPEDAKVVCFNAWQVRGDNSIRRQLILKLVEEVNPQRYQEIIAYTPIFLPLECHAIEEQQQREKEAKTALITKIPLPWWVIMFIFCFVGLLVITVFLLIQGNNASGALATLTASMITAIPAIWGWVINKKTQLMYSQPASESERLNHPEQFLKLFNELVGTRFKSKSQLIVVVDDLDRCDSETVTEALASIQQLKSNCIKERVNCKFLVPCDEQQVVIALESHQTFRETDSYHHDYESELLRKFFDVIIRMDAFIPADMVAFVDSIRKTAEGKRIIPSSAIGPIKELVGAVSPADPRQVKKLINAYLVAQNQLNKQMNSGAFPSNPQKVLHNFEATFLAITAIRETCPKQFKKIVDGIYEWDNLTDEIYQRRTENKKMKEEFIPVTTILRRLPPTSSSTAQWLMFTGVPQALLVVPNAHEIVDVFNSGQDEKFAEKVESLEKKSEVEAVCSWLKDLKQSLGSIAQLKNSLTCLLKVSENKSKGYWVFEVLERYISGREISSALLGHHYLSLLACNISQFNKRISTKIKDVIVSNLERNSQNFFTKDNNIPPELTAIFFFANSLKETQKNKTVEILRKYLKCSGEEKEAFNMDGLLELNRVIKPIPEDESFGFCPEIVDETLKKLSRITWNKYPDMPDTFPFQMMLNLAGNDSEEANKLVQSINTLLASPGNFETKTKNYPAMIAMEISKGLILNVTDKSIIKKYINNVVNWLPFQQENSDIDINLIIDALLPVKYDILPEAHWTIINKYLFLLAVIHHEPVMQFIGKKPDDEPKQKIWTKMCSVVFSQVCEYIRNHGKLFFKKLITEATKDGWKVSREADKLLAYGIEKLIKNEDVFNEWKSCLLPLIGQERPITKQSLLKCIKAGKSGLFINCYLEIISDKDIDDDLATAISQDIQARSANNPNISFPEVDKLLKSKTEGRGKIVNDLVDNINPNIFAQMQICSSFADLMTDDTLYQILEIIRNNYLPNAPNTNFIQGISLLKNMPKISRAVKDQIVRVSEKIPDGANNDLKEDVKRVLKKKVFKFATEENPT